MGTEFFGSPVPNFALSHLTLVSDGVEEGSREKEESVRALGVEMSLKGDISGEGVPGRGNSKAEHPEAGIGWRLFRSCKGLRLAGASELGDAVRLGRGEGVVGVEWEVAGPQRTWVGGHWLVLSWYIYTLWFHF